MEDTQERLKRECIDVGYVNYGYFSPELSSNDEYPDYIKADVKRCIEEIKSRQGENSVTFAFMTDIHYSDTPNHNIRTKRLVNAYKETADAVGADMLMLGGDYVNNGKKEYVKNNYKMLAQHLNGIKYYPVNGNHDDNSFWDEYTENKKAENHLSAKELFDCFYSGLKERNAEFDEKNFGLYYMYNDYAAKIRYIFLDTSDIPEIYDEKGRIAYTKQRTFGIGQKQADWLVNHALKFDDCAWKIVFFAHSVKDEYTEMISELADAFAERKVLKKSYGQVIGETLIDADFTKADAKIICFMCGHYHKDFTERTKGGIPCIYGGNTIMYETPLKRCDGDKSELLFDFVTLNGENIYVTRVGAGESKTVRHENAF